MPGLQWQNVHIPASGGMDESTALRVRAPDKIDVLNGYWKRSGEIVKRNGFTSVTANTAAGTIEGARGIFSTGDELCLIGKRRLWALNDAANIWYDRGQLGPCGLRSRRLFRDAQPFFAGDLAIGNGYQVSAGMRFAQVDESGNFEATLFAKAESLVRSEAVVPVYAGIASGTTAGTAPTGVRCIFVGTKALVLYMVSLSAPGTLNRKEWDSSTPSGTFGGAVSYTANAYVDSLGSITAAIRTFDGIAVSGGTYVVAWIDNTTSDIELRRFNTSHVQQATGTNAEFNFTRVALADDPALDRIYVVALTSEAAPRVLTYAYKRSDLTKVWGPTVCYVSLAGESIDNVSNAAGVNGGTTYVANNWNVHISTSALRNTRIGTAVTDTSGALFGSHGDIYNMLGRSRPFWEDGRCYLMCATTCATQIYTATSRDGTSGTGLIHSVGGNKLQTVSFEGGAMMDIWAAGAVDPVLGRQATLAGVYDVGVAHAGDGTTLRTGNGGNVAAEATSIYRIVSSSNVFNLEGQVAKDSIDEIRADFTAPVTATIVNRGTAAIGGSFVAWYPGDVVEELGWIVPPMGYSLASTDDPVGFTDGVTRQWIGVWEGYDGRGNLVRSLPGAPIEHIVATGGVNPNAYVTLTAKTVAATNKLNRRHYGLSWYRADDDNVYKKVTEPQRYTKNRADSNHQTADFKDDQNIQGPLLYTVSGEIESVCPEGATIVTRGIGRVWLGNLVRGDRIQYSKPIAAGTAFEDALAPEFNEGFGYLLESGEQVTGVGELDDKMVVFTEQEIFLIAGRGPDDAGAANDFSGLVLVSNDAGCVDPRSVCGFPGGVVFRSKAGIYALDRSLGIQFIGDKVRDKTDLYTETTSAVLVPEKTQVRFTCSNAIGSAGIVLVYDYRLGQWSYWDINGGDYVPVGACMHNDVYYMVAADGTVRREDATTNLDDGSYVSEQLDFSWIQAAGRLAWERVRRIVMDGKAEDAHELHMTYFCDHEVVAAEPPQIWTWAELQAFDSIVTREQPGVHPIRGKSQAFRVRILDAEDGDTAPTTGAGFTFDGISFEIGVKRGLPKAGAANYR